MSPVPHVFLAGVGGMGMAPLALLLRASGARVTGWDDDLRPAVQALLVDGGVAIAAGAELPRDATLLVRSSAVGLGHPLVAAALARGIPVERRGERLAALAAGRRLVAIAGSHGKTSTCAWLAHLLGRSGVPASWAIGGLPADGAPPARADSRSDWLVAEVDESDGTIEGFSPEITVVVNLDWDHPDQYPDEASLRAAFDRLVARTRSLVVVPEGDPLVAAAGRHVAPAARVATFPVSGDFQARNAAAASVAFAGMTGEAPSPGALEGYPGVKRRQTVLLETPALAVVEDYAHHPTEITALLGWARRRFPGRRVATVFQPHRYTRTRRYREGFARALAAGSDALCLLDVYPAGEAPVEGGTTRDVAAELPAAIAACTRLVAWQEELDDALAGVLGQGDPVVVLFVGAGDIDAWARTFVWARGGDPAAVEGAPAITGRADWLAALGPTLGEGTRAERSAPLRGLTTLRVGGPARWLVEPAGEEDLARVLAAARAAGVETFLVGRGSNLVVDDAGFPGLVVRLAGPAWSGLALDADGSLVAGAGLMLKVLSARAAREGLTGFEFLDGIPGTVGGSLRMNAGAMGGWIFERVASVRVLGPDLVPRDLPVSAFHPAYRSCPELEGGVVVLGARFLPAGRATPEQVRATLDAHAQYRRRTQPREASAGCAFRNPPGGQAGKLIDLAGLKGTTVGDAMVSPVHANFLVNRGRATAADYLALVDRVRDGVRKVHGIELETEVIRLGRGGKERAA